MSQYLVAVVIPCFNASKFIRKTIDSVLNQDYEPLEIITIDDGSTDETRNILESYLPRIKILSHTNNANLGQAASLNLGIHYTKSDLIAFLDSDDLWYTGKVKDQVKIFEKHTDVGLVYTNGYVIDEKDNALYKIFPEKFLEKNVLGEILLKCYIKTPSSVMVKAEIIEKSGLFRENLHSTDHDMWIRMSEITKFYYIPDILIGYRKHRGQKSSARRQWEDGFTILKEACERYPYSLSLKRKRLTVLYYRLGEYDWRNNCYFRALRNYFLAGVLDPFRAMNVIQSKIRVKKEL